MKPRLNTMSLWLRPTSLPSGILIPSNLATLDIGRKLGAPPPFGGGGAGSPPNTMWPGPRPTCTPSFILLHLTVWPQYINVTDRTGQTEQSGPTEQLRSDSC